MKRAKKGSMKTMRLRKVHCAPASGGCGYVIRLSRKMIEIGVPACPNPDCGHHGQPMSCANPADAVECGLMSLDDLPRTVRTQICRDNGWEDQIIRTSPGRRARPKIVAVAEATPF